MRLSEVAQTASGLTARKRLDPALGRGAQIIQLRDIQPDKPIVVEALDRVELENASEKFRVAGGELIFRSRGTPNIAVVISDLVESATVMSPLFIIRPRLACVLPEYLAWAINRPEAQRYFDNAAQGGTIRMIPKSALEELDIPLPSLETQRRIVALHALAEREAALSYELADLRGQLASLTLEECVRSASKKEMA